jgi:hypothetical protein
MLNMSSPTCVACPHLARQHDLDGDGHCRVRILTDWSEEFQVFTGVRDCDCPGYRGSDPKDACDCEYVSGSPYCVHCGAVRV